MSETPAEDQPHDDDRPAASMPDPGHSVLRTLEDRTGEAPHVTLREEDSASVAAPVIDPSSQEKFSVPQGRGNYQLMGEIARGGMGVILKGHDTDLGRDIAVKVLDKRLSGRLDVVQRFVEEAQIGGQLQHPGIVPVYELGLMADERPYFTMKLVKGRTLAALLAQRETPSSNRGGLIDIFESVCQTMAYAHSRGVIHRDLKPANIMVGAFGEVQVVDWGLAKVLVRGGTADEKLAREAQPQRTILETVRSEGSSSGTESMFGSVLGTPAYMPPEQARGLVDRLDERSDVFALGAILCEILTGSAPYLGKSDEVIAAAAQAELEGAYARLDACGADALLVRAAKQCLTAAPAARPADASVLAERVHQYVVSTEERAHRAEVESAEASVRAQEERKARRLTLALGAAVVAIVLIGSGGWLWVQNERAAGQRMEAERERIAAERDRELAAEVNQALKTAATLEGAGRWDEAILAAERANALAEGGGASGELLASIGAALTGLREAKDEARRREELRLDTQRLLARLREVAQPSELAGDAEKAVRFQDTFLAHGIDLDAGELEVAAETLTRRGLGSQVALVLDSWSEARRQNDDPEGALRLLELAHLVDPDPQRANLREAVGNRELEELRFLASSGFEEQPASTIALLATSLDRLEDRELALSVYRAGVERYPDDFELLYLLARLLTPGPDDTGVRDEMVEAAQCYRAALALQPDNAWVRFYLGRLYDKLGESERSLEQYRLASAAEPDNGRFLFRLGGVLSKLRRLDEARAAFERTATMDEPSWLSHWSLIILGILAVDREEMDQALDYARRGWELARSRGQINAFMLLPFILRSGATGEEGPMLEARRLFEEVFARRPDTHAFLAWVVAQRAVDLGVNRTAQVSPAGRELLLENAVELARTGLEMEPANPDLWQSLGVPLYYRGDAQGAVDALTRAVELRAEGDPVDWFCLAMAHHATGDEDAARRWHLRALSWMAAHPSNEGFVWNDKELQWFRAEVARTLDGE